MGLIQTDHRRCIAVLASARLEGDMVVSPSPPRALDVAVAPLAALAAEGTAAVVATTPLPSPLPPRRRPYHLAVVAVDLTADPGDLAAAAAAAVVDDVRSDCDQRSVCME